MAMYATKAFELVKELERTKDANLPPYDENGIRQIFDEMQALHEQNMREGLNRTFDEDTRFNPGMNLRHVANKRNKQCVLAYIYHRLNRIRDLRWTHGSVLSEQVRLNTTEQEQQYFKNYNKILASYMRSCRGSGNVGNGLDLTIDVKPPKSLMTRVRVLEDWELEDEETGEPILLRKEALHYMDALQAEPLARQGVLEFIE